MKRQKLKFLLALSLRERFELWWRDFLCRVSGHPKPYVRKMWCSICPRCSTVVEHHERQPVVQVRERQP